MGSVLSGLGNTFDGPDADWWILHGPELHLEGDVLVPDVAGWRRTRLPLMPDVEAFDLVPDWVCEVIAPTTQRLDRYYKLPAYARHGVPTGWVITPEHRGIEFWRSIGNHWALVDTCVDDDFVRAEPFENIQIKIAWLP